MPTPVGPTEFAIQQTVGQDTDLQIDGDETIVNFTRVGQNQMRMVISVLFTPASIGQDPPAQSPPSQDPHSIIDFVNHDVYLSGAPLKLTTSIDNHNCAVFSFNTDNLTILSRKDSFGV